mmetsp:Transcript_28015/g.83700  ORF Transcript_28015/g.83700 Transcript_28015/m.83700 type:complete len:270 (+) Transcript_28015:207-1016(+)
MGPRCVQTSWISIPGSVGIAWRSIRKLVPRAPLQPRPATQRRDSAQSPPCARRQCLLLSLVELTTVPLVSSYLSLVCAYCVLRGADGFGRSCPQEQALTGFKILPYNEANGPEKVFLAPTCPARLSSSRRNPSADRRGRTAARRSRRCRRCRSIALQGQGVAAPRSQSARRAAAPGCRGAPSGSGRSTCDRSPASPPTAAAPCRCPCRALRPRRRPARCKPRQAAGCGCHIGPAWDEPPPARSRAACHPLPRRSHTSADALGGVGSSAA